MQLNRPLSIKRVTLCADDYGFNPAISQGILQLVEEKKINAVSCMTNMPHWPEHATCLTPYQNDIAIGLHFNLTEGWPLSCRSSTLTYRNGYFQNLKTLLLKAYSQQLNQHDVIQELIAQINVFSEKMQRLPDFIDGHQHVHQFPIIRTALLHVYQQYFQSQSQKPYIRVAIQKAPLNLKSIIIANCGGVSLRTHLQQYKIPYNSTFSGIYPFQQSHHYPNYFSTFLNAIDDQGLIMCHPAATSSPDDAIGHSRVAEWRYFKSPQFTETCLLHNASILK